jgi:VWFA-related protein
MRFVAVLLILGVGIVVITARPRAQAPQEQPPTFRASVQYIEVDVRVTDREGRVLRDLTKDDFILLEDGKPQTISAAAFVNLEVESPVTRRLPGTVETDVANNAGTGRMWVMLLGGYGLRAQRVARQFVNEALGPNDEVAVVPVHGTMSSAQGFTRNRALMLAGIDRLQSDSPEDIGGDPVVRAYQVLEELSVRLGSVGGRRKAVLFFDPPEFFMPSGDPRDGPRIFAQRDALRAATRNNVAVYVVSTHGLTTELSIPGLPGSAKGPIVKMAGQRFLAEETGGDTIVNSNNFADGYQRFVRATNQYYLLGYTPSVEHRDGEFHSITVRANRPGLTVQARRGYYAPEAGPAPALDAPPQPDTPGLSPDTLEALRLPLSMNGLTVDLAAAPFRGTSGKGSVLLSARVRGDGLALGAGELIEVGYRAMTTEGKTTPGAFYVLNPDLTGPSRAAASAYGFQFVDRMSLAAGRHQIRFAVHQPNGKTGMVVGDVDVPDFKAAISMSGLVVASARLGAQPRLKMDEQMQKLLGTHPTPERSFVRSDTVSAYGEIYTNGGTRPDSVAATVARLGERSRPLTIAVSQSVAEPGRIGALMAIPIRELQAGDYVLTVEAKSKRRNASRQMLFSVTDR